MTSPVCRPPLPRLTTPTCDPKLCSAHFWWLPLLTLKSVNPNWSHPLCSATNPSHSFLPIESAISFPVSENTSKPSFMFFNVFPDHCLTELPSVMGVLSTWGLLLVPQCSLVCVIPIDEYKSSLMFSASFKNGSDYDKVKITLGSPSGFLWTSIKKMEMEKYAQLPNGPNYIPKYWLCSVTFRTVMFISKTTKLLLRHYPMGSISGSINI